MAALNTPVSGDFNGVRGVDYECYRQSRRANMRGTFRAFIASRVQNLDSIVRYKDAKLPIVNTRVILTTKTYQSLYFYKILIEGRNNFQFVERHIHRCGRSVPFPAKNL